MAARAGEKAQESGTFHCAKCNETVRVTKGHEIPKCPKCGNETFDTRTHETTSSRR
ncbi:zinc ribbon-containing protein [Sorangium sp. So ce233]|uniref:zinc ribbon-containing protein n=1 Tax=Sorangium sp. So ce233 TaxID=3133290 RepID=UPI003F6147A8